ncbi:protein of unknown function [Acidithiobacillus ferrivorans]|uniref:PE-PGRS family protein n=1 Tax=Acidithiobacillus ferrivorans TaxID=160808 RepID=A0ABY1MRT9_9PROT|nr:protein of unknown function [Acidithiobacillus ferrivorans]
MAIPSVLVADARQQFAQVAGAVPDIQLRNDDGLHAETDGAGGAGKKEDDGAVTDGGFGTGLDGAGADLLIGEHAEEFAEAGDGLADEGGEGFGGDVAAGDAGAAGGDDHVDGGVDDPVTQLRAQAFGVVGADPAGGNPVSGLTGELGNFVTGLVGCWRTAVGDGEDGNGEG